MALVVEMRGLNVDANLERGAQCIASHLQYPAEFAVFLQRAPRRSDDGFPEMNPCREFAILAISPRLRELLGGSGDVISHVLAWQISTQARLIVPLALNRRVRRLLGLIVLLDRGASENRVDEELKELFMSLLPWRCSAAHLLRALDVMPRTSAPDCLTAS